MGFTPREVDAMSLWEFMACCDGFRSANGGSKGPSGDLSEDELREMGIEGF
mgnify:CR=1 FL=1